MPACPRAAPWATPICADGKSFMPLVREPRRHVLSQFTMCKYSQHMANHSEFPRDDMANATAGFDKWVRVAFVFCRRALLCAHNA